MFSGTTALVLTLPPAATPANAKGCIKGAILGRATETMRVTMVLSVPRSAAGGIGHREPPWAVPTIGAALTAGYPWLSIYCCGYQTVQDLDLRTIDRHPAAAVRDRNPDHSQL